MKQNTKKTNITAVSRKSGWLPLVAFAAMLAGCTADDTLPVDGSDNIPVSFATSHESVALPQATATNRTATNPTNGQTVWAQGDAVGVFMLAQGGTSMPNDIYPGADNVKYNVSPATGELVPAGTPIYYPQTGKVDFIALYPYSDKGESDGKITTGYEYTISVADQTNPSTIDVLYAKTTDKEKSKSPINLSFGHVLSKIKLNIQPIEGLTGITADKITAVTINGMPASATLALQDGTLTAGAVDAISAIKETTPSTDATATFTALVPPQTAGVYSRRIIVTVNGEDYSGTIPATDAYVSNEMYTYPVTLQKSDIAVGKPVIAPWETEEHGTGTATEVGAGIEKVLIPAGTFLMGSPTNEPNRLDDETLHQVTLTKDFYMSKYEITSQQYAEFLNDMGIAGIASTYHIVSHNVEGHGEQPLFLLEEEERTPKWDEETQQWKGENKYPMLNVSWYGAKAYADWIGGALPTEAQWEYACRAGTTTAFWFGDDGSELGKYAWYLDNSDNTPHLVGGKLPNPWGLYDMYGNVSEWCADWYDSEYYNNSPDRDPTGPHSGTQRVLRGGDYMNIHFNSHSSRRSQKEPEIVNRFYGFRVVFVP